MAEKRRYGAYPGFDGYTPSGFRRLSKAKKIEAMVAWFGANFEDPAHRTPYETAEGGYQWIHGGPFDASEQVGDEFADVEDLEAIQLAVDEIQSDGIYDWAPTPDHSDYDVDPDELAEEGFPYTLPITFQVEQPSAGTSPTASSGFGSGSFGAGPYGGRVFEPGVFEEDEPPRDEAAVRREMLDRLEHLERLIEPLIADTGMIGHNNPPGPIEDPELPEHEPHLAEPPLTARDLNVVKTAIHDIREQAQAEVPDREVVENSRGILSRAAKQLGRWLMMAADEAVKAAGKAAGVALVAGAVMGWQHVGPALETAASSVSAWIQTIQVPW